ncbi:hypothetical protein DYB28_015825, partial [Aphanomyces astaci]
DGHQLQVIGRGTVRLEVAGINDDTLVIYLQDVYHIPDLHFNLFSVGRALHMDRHQIVSITPQEWTLATYDGEFTATYDQDTGFEFEEIQALQMDNAKEYVKLGARVQSEYGTRLTYTNAYTSTRDLEAATGIPKSCVARWMQQATQLLLADGPLKRYNLSGAGRPEEVPDTAALVAYMHKLRDAERAVTCTHLVNFLKRHHRPWLDVYLATKKAGYPSLLRLLQRCCHRHGFTRQKAAKSKKTQADLEAIRAEFAADYHKAFDGFSPDTVINVDETGMTYDMPPHAIWSVRGGSAKIAGGEKNSYRMTAVLAVRANGEKLPIQFIMRGKKGGAIEKT